MKSIKKSPINHPPLRYPGQSIDDEIDRNIAKYNDRLTFSIMLGLAILFFTYIAIFQPTINPVGGLICYTPIIAILIFQMRKYNKTIDQLKLARDGERAVGQYLDNLREIGARILHDVRDETGKQFNVDHIILSEHGFFAVDTKTYSKPAKGEAKIHIKDGEVYANQFKIDRNPLAQAKAEAKWVQDILLESTGKKFSVKPVVVFPGWYVDRMNGNSEVWVLNPKALPTFIQNCEKLVTKEDMHLAFFHLTRYVRSLK